MNESDVISRVNKSLRQLPGDMFAWKIKDGDSTVPNMSGKPAPSI